jgi:hypothetical protein
MGALRPAGLGDGDGGAERPVRRVAERHDDVERVGGAALEEHDERPTRTGETRGPAGQLLREHAPAEEARRQAERHEREGARLDEGAAVHGCEA